jgi:hypothetical protein
MSGPSDVAVDLAISKLELDIVAAKNANHNGEVAVVRAASAYVLESALRLLLPEIKNSIASGDGRFTPEQISAAEDALRSARGDFTAHLFSGARAA